ncbi:MAG: hypothetical protein LAT67_01140 [Balneolales bacterium]|nr:hypothetical protein [Balneolales bacterium]
MSQSLTIQLFTDQADDRPVYIAGNFNDWSPALDRYKLKKNNDFEYEFVFELVDDLPDVIEYKFTRGGWSDAELDHFGNEASERMISKYAVRTKDRVPHWKRNNCYYSDAYRPLINIFDENFEIPQLIKTRRITALLPYDYFNSDKHYPVLYLQDGQNLFDDHAPFGSWGLDKRLAFLSEHNMAEFIVIAIDHAEDQRIAEFTPSIPTSRLGAGEGESYARFLTETLKPYVDTHFRTKPEREYTGIGGSSMGGLISIYAAKLFPETYSRLLLFSPSFWVTPGLPDRFIDEAKTFEGRIYIYGGGDESKFLLGRLETFHTRLEAARLSGRNITSTLSVNLKGKHSEVEWSREFPMAAVWLFGD